MKRKMLLVTLLVLLFGMASAFQNRAVCAYTLEGLVNLTRQIQNENPGIDFKIRTDKDEYKVGEDVVIEFMADKDCYLALIDIGTSGRTIILFPNKWHPDNKIEKGKTYAIPPSGSNFSYRVLGPGGNETIKAIASVDPVLSKVESLQEELKQPIETKPEKGQVFLSMKDPGVVLKDIGILFQKLDPSKWATAEYTFKISDAGTGVKPSQEEQPRVTPGTQPPESTEVFKGKDGSYEIRYDPAKWKLGRSSNALAETAFYHTEGDTQVNVIYERLKAPPMATVKKTFLDNLKKLGTNFVVKEEKELEINKAPVTSIIVNFTIDGIGYTVHGYLWTGDSGVIQLIGGYDQSLASQFRSDVEKLLNGLVVTKP